MRRSISYLKMVSTLIDEGRCDVKLKRILCMVLVWFYEGFTPQNWKENDNLAVCLWEEMISGIWPGVKRYS